jgi:hypothetical protein
MPEREVRGWLLQVLTEAPQTDWDKGLDKMSFGGGGSGLTKDAWAIVNKLFGFEYMGSAEFEFGALPKALHALSKAELDTSEVIIEARHIERDDWTRTGLAKKKEVPPYPGDTTVYVLSQKGQLDDIKKILKGVADGSHRCKDYHRGKYIFDPIKPEGRRYIGWLNVQPEEAFIALTDKTTFERVCAVFGMGK